MKRLFKPTSMLCIL